MFRKITVYLFRFFTVSLNADADKLTHLLYSSINLMHVLYKVILSKICKAVVDTADCNLDHNLL